MVERTIEQALRGAGAAERWTDTAGYRTLAHAPRIGSILVLKVDHVGDFILGFDALFALREAFPHASLGMFDRIHTVSFFAQRADGEHPRFHPDMVPSLNAKHFDLAIDLRIDPDTRVILRHVQATYKVGFDSPDHRDMLILCLPHYLPGPQEINIGLHQTLLMLRLVRSTADLFIRHDGVEALLRGRVAKPATIDLSAARGRILVACNTSSGRAAKNWPHDRFRALIRWLVQELGCAVLLLGGKDQQAEADDIIAHCAGAPVISAIGGTTLNEAIGLIAQASIFIGNDSALTHVAARMNIPTVAIFSGIDPTVMWAPVGGNVTVLRAPVPCSPCHILHMRDCRGDHACILNISDSAVQAAVRAYVLTAPRFGEVQILPTETPISIRRHAAFRGWASSVDPQNAPRGLSASPVQQWPIAQFVQGFAAGRPLPRGDMNRFYAFTLLFEQIASENIAGDLAEYDGGETSIASMLTEFAPQIGASVHLLDCTDLIHPPRADSFADATRTVPRETRFCLAHLGSHPDAVFVPALDFFYARLAPGGFLVMHDDSATGTASNRRAIDAFFADKPEGAVPIPDSSGMMILRRCRRPEPVPPPPARPAIPTAAALAAERGTLHVR
jgi:ADP-heptose:LPS heptosyltransferase